jgi:phosphatidylinositol glycan class V
MAPPVAGVVRLAAASRVLVLSLYLLARLLFRPYDTSATLHPPCLSSPPLSPDPNTPVSTAISSLAVWDGVHFARPAECGYEYEQSFAFLPLLPASLALLARSRKPARRTSLPRLRSDVNLCVLSDLVVVIDPSPAQCLRR